MPLRAEVRNDNDHPAEVRVVIQRVTCQCRCCTACCTRAWSTTCPSSPWTWWAARPQGASRWPLQTPAQPPWTAPCRPPTPRPSGASSSHHNTLCPTFALGRLTLCLYLGVPVPAMGTKYQVPGWVRAYALRMLYLPCMHLAEMEGPNRPRKGVCRGATFHGDLPGVAVAGSCR